MVSQPAPRRKSRQPLNSTRYDRPFGENEGADTIKALERISEFMSTCWADFAKREILRDRACRSGGSERRAIDSLHHLSSIQ